MKKITSFTLSLVLLIGLCACNAPTTEPTTEPSTDPTTAPTTESSFNTHSFTTSLNGIWVLMSTATDTGFEFVSFNDGEFCPAAYPGGAGRTGKIYDVAQDTSDTYTLYVLYKEEEYMGDYYPEERTTLKIKHNDKELTLLDDNTCWTYMGNNKSLEEIQISVSTLLHSSNNNSNNSQSSVIGKWNVSYVMYTSGGMNNLKGTHYTLELFSDGTGTENFLGEVRNFKWTLQKDNDGLSGHIQFGTLTPAWLYYRGSNLIIDTGSSQTFFSKG